MAKKRTSEQEALRRAWNTPEKRTRFSWRSCWGHFTWPCSWSFFFNWKNLSVAIGEPTVKFYGDETPENKFNFSIMLKPFGIVCFWEQRRIFWIGDWRWKKSLFKD